MSDDRCPTIRLGHPFDHEFHQFGVEDMSSRAPNIVYLNEMATGIKSLDASAMEIAVQIALSRASLIETTSREKYWPDLETTSRENYWRDLERRAKEEIALLSILLEKVQGDGWPVAPHEWTFYREAEDPERQADMQAWCDTILSIALV